MPLHPGAGQRLGSVAADGSCLAAPHVVRALSPAGHEHHIYVTLRLSAAAGQWHGVCQVV